MTALLRFSLLTGLTAGLACASIVNDFRFQNNLNDSVSAATLTSLGGTVGPSAYTFGAGQGLSLSSPGFSDPGNYTVALLFSFDAVTGYRRVLDFLNQTSDTGLYVLSGALDFYNAASGPANAINANTPVTVVVTRDSATSILTAYVNGSQALSFTDSSSLGVFSGASNIAYFFKDDTAVGGENSGGSVNRIVIWDNVLSANAVGALDLSTIPGVPEPSTFSIAGLGCAALFVAQRLRRRA